MVSRLLNQSGEAQHSTPHPPKVYVFRDWQDAVACAAPGPQVLAAFGTIGDVSTFFGGYLTYGRLFRSDEFVGVWGHRNTGRFRRILRERFGDLEVVHAKPPARLSGRSLTGSRKSASERQALELRLKHRWPEAVS